MEKTETGKSCAATSKRKTRVNTRSASRVIRGEQSVSSVCIENSAFISVRIVGNSSHVRLSNHTIKWSATADSVMRYVWQDFVWRFFVTAGTVPAVVYVSINVRFLCNCLFLCRKQVCRKAFSVDSPDCPESGLVPEEQ